MPRSFRLAACLLLPTALLLAGCLGDAPRDNPLDPLSDAFRDEGAVAGQVIGAHPPFPPRAGVQVRLVPTTPGRPELATRTGAEGRFALAGIPAGAYAVVADGEPYRAAVDTVAVTAGATAEVTLQLDALPQVVAQSLRTVHLARWPPFDALYQLEVEVAVTDPDRPDDVAAAALVVPALGLRADLGEGDREADTTFFRATFGAETLPEGRVQSLLGRSLFVEVEDEDGEAALGPPASLVRVIEQTPQPVRPTGLQTVTENPPTLVWNPALLPFDFTYRVELFVVAGDNLPSRLLTVGGIAPAATTFDLPEPLPAGDYFWTLWVVDEAGNRSRSREAGFRVP